MCVLFVSCRSPARASTVQQAREQTERGPALTGCSCCLSLLFAAVVVVCCCCCCCCCAAAASRTASRNRTCQHRSSSESDSLGKKKKKRKEKKKNDCRSSFNLRGGLTSVVRTGLQAAHPAESCSSAFIRCAGCLSPISPRARLHGECDSLLHCALKAGLRLATTANRGFDWYRPWETKYLFDLVFFSFFFSVCLSFFLFFANCFWSQVMAAVAFLLGNKNKRRARGW